MQHIIPKCKTRLKLEEFFKMPFHKIVETHLKSGWSRYICAEHLQRLTGETIAVKHATLWNCVKTDIELGLIKDFDFKGRTKGHKKYHRTKVGKPASKCASNKSLKVTYNCLQCGHTYIDDKALDPPFEIIRLRGHICPNAACKTMGKTKAEFDYKGIHAIKAVIKNEKLNAIYECFVNGEMEEIDNPFVTPLVENTH